MAYATQMTLGTGNKVSVNYQSQEHSVSVTYQLEREDTNLLQVVQEMRERLRSFTAPSAAASGK